MILKVLLKRELKTEIQLLLNLQKKKDVSDDVQSNSSKKLKNNTESSIKKRIKNRNPVIIKFAKKRDSFDDVQPNPSKKLKFDTEYLEKKKKKRKQDLDNYITKYTKKPYETRYGRSATRLFEKK